MREEELIDLFGREQLQEAGITIPTTLVCLKKITDCKLQFVLFLNLLTLDLFDFIFIGGRRASAAAIDGGPARKDGEKPRSRHDAFQLLAFPLIQY